MKTVDRRVKRCCGAIVVWYPRTSVSEAEARADLEAWDPQPVDNAWKLEPNSAYWQFARTDLN